MSNEGTERPEGPFDLPPVDSAPPPSFGQDAPPPPPRPAGWSVPPAQPVRRLVRDPGASLGGVASGLSQHYGLDVSIIRLAFVLFTLISGVGILLYILAWLIIPKGDVWPPAGAKTVTNRLSNREIGIGAILIGLAMVVYLSGGSVGEVIVPLLLLGGGIWLLNQSESQSESKSESTRAPATAQAAAGPWPPPGTDQPQDTVAQDPYVHDPLAQNAMGHGAPGVPPGVGYGAAPQPPKRRRPLRAIFIGLIALVCAFFAIIIAAIVAVVAFGDVNFETDGSETYTPLTVADIPTSIQLDAGEIVLDLSAIDSADFGDNDIPLNLDIEMDAGEIRIVIPEDLAVEIDAAANIGDVDVFDDNDDGFSPRVSWSDDDPDLRLDVNVGLGAVIVERP